MSMVIAFVGVVATCHFCCRWWLHLPVVGCGCPLSMVVALVLLWCWCDVEEKKGGQQHPREMHSADRMKTTLPKEAKAATTNEGGRATTTITLWWWLSLPCVVGGGHQWHSGTPSREVAVFSFLHEIKRHVCIKRWFPLDGCVFFFF